MKQRGFQEGGELVWFVVGEYYGVCGVVGHGGFQLVFLYLLLN